LYVCVSVAGWLWRVLWPVWWRPTPVWPGHWLGWMTPSTVRETSSPAGSASVPQDSPNRSQNTAPSPPKSPLTRPTSVRRINAPTERRNWSELTRFSFWRNDQWASWANSLVIGWPVRVRRL